MLGSPAHHVIGIRHLLHKNYMWVRVVCISQLSGLYNSQQHCMFGFIPPKNGICLGVIFVVIKISILSETVLYML